VVALATGRHDLLPRAYRDPGNAWRRLDDRQRALVRRYHPFGAEHAAARARSPACTCAWH